MFLCVEVIKSILSSWHLIFSYLFCHWNVHSTTMLRVPDYLIDFMPERKHRSEEYKKEIISYSKNRDTYCKCEYSFCINLSAQETSFTA